MVVNEKKGSRPEILCRAASPSLLDVLGMPLGHPVKTDEFCWSSNQDKRRWKLSELGRCKTHLGEGSFESGKSPQNSLVLTERDRAACRGQALGLRAAAELRGANSSPPAGWVRGGRLWILPVANHGVAAFDNAVQLSCLVGR